MGIEAERLNDQESLPIGVLMDRSEAAEIAAGVTVQKILLFKQKDPEEAAKQFYKILNYESESRAYAHIASKSQLHSGKYQVDKILDDIAVTTRPMFSINQALRMAEKGDYLGLQCLAKAKGKEIFDSALDGKYSDIQLDKFLGVLDAIPDSGPKLTTPDPAWSNPCFQKR